jgi:preprotein translocase SecE subunit
MTSSGISARPNRPIRSGSRCPTSPKRTSRKADRTVRRLAVARHAPSVPSAQPARRPPGALQAEAGNGDTEPPAETHHSNEPAHPRKGLFGRAADFLRASYAELRRVQWPDRRQVGQGTAVTLGFVVVAGAYLGLLDAIWNPIIQAIL